MKNFTYFHCYEDDLWAGYEKNGLLRESFGIRFPQAINLAEDKLFNSLLKKDGNLYNYIKEKRCGLYVDRIQGGNYFQEYDYDEDLINEYREMLGDKFLGFQIHEWLSNYRNDVCSKLGDLSKEEWTEENIIKIINEKFPFPYLFVEAMSVKEFVETGKPETFSEFYDNMTSIYKKRAEKHPLLPCDSYGLMYVFEAENGATAIMPELGAQIPDARLQMCFARGVCRSYNVKLGAYYEPWGGDPFSTCSFYPNDKNEWGIEDSADFPFVTGGVNGGSSRSLQWRIHLYAYLSGAEFISEEWGGYNTFKDGDSFELSEYGLVKKKFLDFVDKYPDIGEKVAPIAAVISNSLPCFTLIGYDSDDIYNNFGFPLEGDALRANLAAKDGVKKIFKNAVEMHGNESHVLINSDIPDAVDMLNESDGKALAKYTYLVNMTGDEAFNERYGNCITADEVEAKLHELLPCRVDGGFHYLLNECNDGFYLSVFNQSGILRSQAKGDEVLPIASKTAVITVKDGKKLIPLEGQVDICFNDGAYTVELNGGDWLFAKII